MSAIRFGSVEADLERQRITREKLKDDTVRPRFLVTECGIGYRLDDESYQAIWGARIRP